jgi:hypothetical protein
MLDVLTLATIEHAGIEHNDASRHLMYNYQHLWRLTWGGCFNLERMGTRESMCCPPMLKSRQQRTSVKWMSTVSLRTFPFILLILFLISGFRNVAVHHLSTDEYVCAALIRQGLLPCAPYSPTTAITIRALELFRLTNLRCPHTTVHSFVKTLCDMHCVPYKLYLHRQFTIAFDLYLSIRTAVDRLVQASLKRDGADYRIKHLCPCCTYILEDEVKLKFSMLYTVDGNDSLKRIIQREAVLEPTAQAPEPTAQAPATTEETALPILGASSEVKDSQTVERGIYLTREQVDEWAKEEPMEEVPGFEYDDDNPCAERWRNMKTKFTAKMWGIFDETGIFLALCRHGFVLVLADMVRSGEL